MQLVDQHLLEKSKKFVFARKSEISPNLTLRIEQLNPADRCFLQLAMDDTRTLRSVAKIVGCDPGTVSRRLKSLRRRLHSPLVIALFERRLSIPEDYREIGLDYFLRGRNTREIALLRDLSRFQVQQLIHFMQSWFSGLCANPQLSVRRSRALLLSPDENREAH